MNHPFRGNNSYLKILWKILLRGKPMVLQQMNSLIAQDILHYELCQDNKAVSKNWLLTCHRRLCERGNLEWIRYQLYKLCKNKILIYHGNACFNALCLSYGDYIYIKKINKFLFLNCWKLARYSLTCILVKLIDLFSFVN